MLNALDILDMYKHLEEEKHSTWSHDHIWGTVTHLQLGWWVGCMGGSPTDNFQIAWCFLQTTEYK